MKTIKLIYDKYENDIGVLYDEKNEIEMDKTKIVDNLPTKINDIDINSNRLLNIFSWGIKFTFLTFLTFLTLFTL